MAGRAPQRIVAVQSLSIGQVGDTATQRALEATSDAVQRLQATRSRVVKIVDLLIGTNVVRHGLGRAAQGFAVTKTFATIAYGDAINTDNPNPELEIWIDVVGSDQLGARVEIW